MKTWARVLIAVLCLALPFGVRALWFNQGIYQPPTLPTMDAAGLTLPAPEYRTYTDQPKVSQPGGRVVVDLSRFNNLEIDDLAPLRDRLAERGLELVTYDGYSDVLEVMLRGATAMLVIAPTTSYEPLDRAAIRNFVYDGGRLLIAADPTRPVPLEDEFSLFAAFFSVSATPAANSLANEFGIVFYDDYLYNIDENQGGYRNVAFAPAGGAAVRSLVDGLDQVVFPAAHSLRSAGADPQGTASSALFVGDQNTRSNIRTSESGFVPAALSADGNVLALGDVTFMTPPYNTLADNDHFLSNLADWIAQDTRQWSLEEFPYLFQRPVDMIQTFAEALPPGLLAASSPLQQALDLAEIPAGLRTEPEKGHDALYLATFDQMDDLQDLLEASGVSITPPAPAEEAADAVDLADTGSGNAFAGPEDVGGLIEVEGFGSFIAAGASLFLVDNSAEGTQLLVAAQDADALSLAMNRLVSNDFSSCATYEALTICSNDSDTNFDNQDQTDGAGQGLPRIFILSDDDGQVGVSTGADEMSQALSASYEVFVWSTLSDGIPTTDEIAGYDAYIITTGDFVGDSQSGFALLPVLEQYKPLLIIGEQPYEPSEVDTTALLADIEVVDGTHPLAFGFSQGQTIPLLESYSGIPAVIFAATPENQPVFARGPLSEGAGVPVVVANEEGGTPVIVAGFAFYRLPEEFQPLFIFNAVDWLLNGAARG